MRAKYFDKREFYVEAIYFLHDGIVYRGNGVLRWKPETGFRLVAKIIEESRANKKEIRSIEIKKPSRMRFEIAPRGERFTAITPFLNINDMALLFNQPFTVNFGRAVFFRNFHHQNEATNNKWFGSAMYEVDQAPSFPDTIYKDIKVGDRALGKSFSKTGFDYFGENGEHIYGKVEEKQYLYFDWSLPKNKWSKGRSWRFAEALQDALSIISGNITMLRYHEPNRNHRVAKEYNAKGKPTSLGIVFRLLDFDFIQKYPVIHLAFYLSDKSTNEDIIRKMFQQIVDASKQNSKGGQALLLSTVLEASLRTVYEMPFVLGRSSRDDPYKPYKILYQFQKDYLIGKYQAEWENQIKNVLAAYKRLRHRYAHPDWITTQGGMLSNQEIEQALNDMILLSRFYGYMILALSGIKDLEPKFPTPFSNWGPIMTMTIGS